MSEQSPKCACMGAGPAITAAMKQFGPPKDAVDHFRSARVEFLKGLRAMLDRQIEDLSKAPSPDRGSRVNVE